MADSDESRSDRLPRLAVVAGLIGFVLTASLIGFIGCEALRGSGGEAPVLSVRAGDIHPTPGGYRVEFEARNASSAAAAAVEVEATLVSSGSEPVTSVVSLDYVPGHSSKKGGVVLPADPRQGSLELRVTGYAEP